MKKGTLIILASGLLGVALVWKQIEKQEPAESSKLPERSSKGLPSSSFESPIQLTRPHQVLSKKAVVEFRADALPELPSLVAFRAEIKADPHGTPKSALRFGDELVVHLENALNDESYADQFVTYLSRCGSDADKKDLPYLIRETCLHIGGQIAAKFPHNASISSKMKFALEGLTPYLRQRVDLE